MKAKAFVQLLCVVMLAFLSACATTGPVRNSTASFTAAQAIAQKAKANAAVVSQPATDTAHTVVLTDDGDMTEPVTPATSASPEQSVVHTELFQLPDPFLLTSLSRRQSTTLEVMVWQIQHPDAQVVSATPVIDVDKITAWSVDWVTVDPKKREIIHIGYLREEQPIALLPGADIAKVTNDLWSAPSKELDGQNLQPIKLNTLVVDDKPVVLGMWYLFTHSGITIGLHGARGYWSKGPKKVFGSPMESAAYYEHQRSLALSLPASIQDSVVAMSWDRLHGINTGETVMMKPFLVGALKDMMRYRSKLVSDENGVTEAIEVTMVKEGSIYADAGMKVGMVITGGHVNDGGDLVLRVTNHGTSENIVIGADKLRPYLKKDGMPGVTPATTVATIDSSDNN